VRAFLSAALEGIGHRVLLAQDGPEGLAKLQAAAPDLVLLDYAMPLMHGADVARAARSTHPDLPIVFVTGYAETDSSRLRWAASARPAQAVHGRPACRVLDRHLPARPAP
jgi:CheY-like chemotaxis protein